MEATLTAQKEGLTDAKVHVRPYEDGGVLMGPIGVDYMHRAVTETNVQVLVDQSVADCSLDKKNMSKCLFAFDEALTPTVTQITSIRTGTGTYSVSIAGVRLSCLEEANTMDCGIQVLVGALYECSVSQSSDTNILCQIKTPFLEAGMLFFFAA